MSNSVPVAVVERLRAAGCVFAEEEAALLVAEAMTPLALDELVARRVGGTPLEQVLGWAEFCGLRIGVTPRVFVPRRRTELLVRAAAVLLAGDGRPVVVDLCCGSGAVGVALGARADIELHAVELDPIAVRCARANVAGAVYEGDLYVPLPAALRGRVEIIVANAPYVPTDELGLLPAEARNHEPLMALDGGADGLAIQRRIAADAASWLAPTGHLLIETSARQAVALARAFATADLSPSVVHDPELDATVVIGALIA